MSNVVRQMVSEGDSGMHAPHADELRDDYPLTAGHVRGEAAVNGGAQSASGPRPASVTIELLQLSDEAHAGLAGMRRLNLPHELFGSSDELLGITVVPLEDASYEIPPPHTHAASCPCLPAIPPSGNALLSTMPDRAVCVFNASGRPLMPRGVARSRLHRGPGSRQARRVTPSPRRPRPPLVSQMARKVRPPRRPSLVCPGLPRRTRSLPPQQRCLLARLTRP